MKGKTNERRLTLDLSGGLGSWRREIARGFQVIGGMLGIEIEIDGMQSTRAQGQRGLKLGLAAQSAAASTVLPLTVSMVSSGVFTVSPGLVASLAVRANSTTGSAISNASPPTWSLSSGYLYLVVQFSPTFESGYMTYHGGTPIAYVKDFTTAQTSDKAAGKFVRPLAQISGSAILNDYSVRSNLEALYGDSGAADGKMECALVRA